MQGAGCMLQGIILFLIFGKYNSHRANNMNNYRDLEIYKLAFDLASRVHKASLKLPKFELLSKEAR